MKRFLKPKLRRIEKPLYEMLDGNDYWKLKNKISKFKSSSAYGDDAMKKKELIQDALKKASKKTEDAHKSIQERRAATRTLQSVLQSKADRNLKEFDGNYESAKAQKNSSSIKILFKELMPLYFKKQWPQADLDVAERKMIKMAIAKYGYETVERMVKYVFMFWNTDSIRDYFLYKNHGHPTVLTMFSKTSLNYLMTLDMSGVDKKEREANENERSEGPRKGPRKISLC